MQARLNARIIQNKITAASCVISTIIAIVCTLRPTSRPRPVPLEGLCPFIMPRRIGRHAHETTRAQRVSNVLDALGRRSSDAS